MRNHYHSFMAISYEFWLRNLLEAAVRIADQQTQAQRWLAVDVQAWERPVEFLLTLEDCNFELFIKEYRSLFSEPQLTAATELEHAAGKFDCDVDGWRDRLEVLYDPAWEDVRSKARAFISAFTSER